MKAHRYPRKDELIEFARDYANNLPGWAFYQDEYVVGASRTAGPLSQNLWLGGLSSGRYRILHQVDIPIPHLAAIRAPFPSVGMLSQYPMPPFETVQTSQHAVRRERVLEAMKRELKPDILTPLVVDEVAQICAPQERTHVENDILMMAILYAWVGERNEARRRCIRVQSMPIPDVEPDPERFVALKAFALELHRAIESGVEREFLERLKRPA
ncbi:MAG: hypothetical protein ABL889_22990 [Terricaulis sp.]